MKRFVLVALSMCTPLVHAQELPVTGDDSLQAGMERERMVEQIRLPESREQSDLPEQPADTPRSEIRIRSRFECEITPTLGTTTGAYLGSPLHSYQRVVWTNGDAVQAGVLIEKDPGEARYSDFTSYHVAFTGIGPVTRLVLGDYTIEEGEGLALSRGYGLSKGSDVVRPVMRSRAGILPYLSSDETHYFNGAAAECRIKGMTAAVFWSRRTYTARVDGRGNALSISTNTSFQTSSAQEPRDNFTERLFGSRMRVQFTDHCTAGIGLLSAHFSMPMVVDDSLPPQVSDVSISGDYSAAFGGVASQGELTLRGGSAAWISTILATITERCRFVLSCRVYPPSMRSLHASGFGTSGDTRNERGVYCGLACSPARTTHISIYYDQYAAVLPVAPMFFVERGNDLMVSLSCVPVRRLTLDLRMRTGTGDESSASGSDVMQRTECRLGIRHAVSAAVELSARFALLVRRGRISQREEWGRLFHAEIRSIPGRAADVSFRVVFFHTDSYAARIYEAERGPVGMVSVPALYGSGIRWYLSLRYHPADWLTWSLKYTDLVRDDVRRIGTGLNQLPANHDAKVAVQTDMAL